MFNLMITLLALASTAQAAESPFEQGTAVVKLTNEERANLEQYINQSKAVLELALEDARGKSIAGARDLYLKAIRKVVIDSYGSRPRTELLMRFVLNQALELTYGVPTADGKAISQPGVLANASNTDLMTVILEDSIKIALKYVEADFDAVKKSSMLDLPFVELASRRLAYARGWVAAILEEERTAALLQSILQHWLNTVARADQLHQAKLALEIREIDGTLKELEFSVSTNEEKIRLLRRKLGWLIPRVVTAEQMQSAGLASEASNNYVAPPTAREAYESARIYKYRSNPQDGVLTQAFAVDDSGLISAGYTALMPDGAGKQQALDVKVQTQLFDVCAANGTCDSDSSIFDHVKILSFETTLRVKLPQEEGQSAQVTLQHLRAHAAQFLMKGIGLTWGTVAVEHKKMNFGGAQYNALLFMPASIEYAEFVPNKDGMVEIIARGNVAFGFPQITDNRGVSHSPNVAMLGGASIGVRIAKTALLMLVGDAGYVLNNVEKESTSKSSRASLGFLSYGAEASLQATDWLHFKLSVKREHVTFVRESSVNPEENRNDKTSGWTAGGAVEVKW